LYADLHIFLNYIMSIKKCALSDFTIFQFILENLEQK